MVVGPLPGITHSSIPDRYWLGRGSPIATYLIDIGCKWVREVSLILFGIDELVGVKMQGDYTLYTISIYFHNHDKLKLNTLTTFGSYEYRGAVKFMTPPYH